MISKGQVKDIIVVGAGLVGSLVSIYLAQRGYNVRILERRTDMRKEGAAGGRSINLALSNRGWLPLEETGVAAAVKEMIIPMPGRIMHDETGNLTFQPYGQEGQAINSVSRAGLNQLLMYKAEENGVEIIFDHRCLDVDVDNCSIQIEHNGAKAEFTADLIIGADGAFSAVRGALQKTDRFNYQQRFIEHGYKELSIPALADGSFAIEKSALHIWPRGNYMLIALPNKDGSFTCTLFFPFDGNPSFSSLKSPEDVQSFFQTAFPDAVALLTNLEDEFFGNPTSSLVTINCYPWVRNRVLIIGDASHAIVPFYGQGMNSGFEDCRILNAMIGEFEGEWDALLSEYQIRRKPDADAILDLALRNFIEMRDLVGDETFLLRKKIEAKLQQNYPDKWIPLYSMVTFNEHIPYSEALRLGDIQQSVMDEVMLMPNLESNWETMDYDSIIAKLESQLAQSPSLS